MVPAGARKSLIDLKHYNLNLVYGLLRDAGPISRIELAKRTGLSATSMTRIVLELSELGLVREFAAEADGAAGRPAARLDLNTDAAYCLCVDLMIFQCKLSIMDVKKNFVAYRELHVASGSSFEKIADLIRDTLPLLAADAGIPVDRIRRCGVSISGHVQNDIGRIAASGQFQFWDVDAKGILEGRLHIPVIVENDCKSALIGEISFLQREAGGAPDVVYIKFGWGGVGSAVMIGGTLLRGVRNAAGEIGHITALPGGETCRCGRRGCFETVLSAQAVVSRAKRINPVYASIEEISSHLGGKDPALDALIDDVADYIAMAIGDVACAYNPELVLLNGPLVTVCRACYDRVLRKLDKPMMDLLNPGLEIHLARMGTNAGLYGIGCITVEEQIHRMLMRLNDER